MKTLTKFAAILLIQFLMCTVLFADEAQFRLIEARNDGVIGGELYLDLEMRISNGQMPRTLNSFTIDIYYGDELQEWPEDDPSVNWSFSWLDGYNLNAVKLSGYYRIFVTGNNVNVNNNNEPPGSPAGWSVTDEWQRITTLRWKIKNNTWTRIAISDDTDAGAYFVNYSNAPQGIVANWDVSNQDLEMYLGYITLPVELSSFSAGVCENYIHLQWDTDNEQNSLGFYILRSTKEDDGFVRINDKIISALNKSNSHGEYNYKDYPEDFGNMFYYKLECVDNQGQSSFYGPYSVYVIDKAFLSQKAFNLFQNYPNPFNPETDLRYQIPKGTLIELSVYNILGKRVVTLVNEYQTKGYHTIHWNGKDEEGKLVVSGIYLAKMSANGFVGYEKMFLLK